MHWQTRSCCLHDFSLKTAVEEFKKKKSFFFPPPTHSMHNLFPLLSSTTVNLEYVSIKTELYSRSATKVELGLVPLKYTKFMHSKTPYHCSQPAAFALVPPPGLAQRSLQQTSPLNGGLSLSLPHNTSPTCKGFVISS